MLGLKSRKETYQEMLEMIKGDGMVNMRLLVSPDELGKAIEKQLKNACISKKKLRKRTNRELLAILTIEQMYKHNELELNQIQVANLEWIKQTTVIAAVVIDRL